MSEVQVPNWPTSTPKWDEETFNLLQNSSNSKLNIILNDIIELSDKFPIKFPIESVRCKTLVSSVNKETLQRNINSAYPLIHEYGLFLCAKFLLYKREHGTSIEKKLYKDMSVLDFIDRLLTKRGAMFMGKWDSYILMNNIKGAGKWETIGTNKEKSPLLLNDCLSYDEIKLSVFLSVSSYSYFINNGSRKNKGFVSKPRSDIEEEGIIIGLIGARLKRVNTMEFQEMVITKTQNTPENGYDGKSDTIHSVFANFYEEPCITYTEAVSNLESANKRFIKLNDERIFDNVVFSKRLVLSFDTLLLEANSRAKEVNKTAYIHLVGIGLGVWKVSDHQKDVFVDTFIKRLSVLGSKLGNISDVDFAYIGSGISNKDYKNHLYPIKDHPNKGIFIHVSKRQPHTKIDAGKLLVVSYAWDGNALPGNEFWKGLLGSSGDSAAAASTQISELHNPHINKRVCAAELRVVTPDGLMSVDEYLKKIEKCVGHTAKKLKT